GSAKDGAQSSLTPPPHDHLSEEVAIRGRTLQPLSGTITYGSGAPAGEVVAHANEAVAPAGELGAPSNKPGVQLGEAGGPAKQPGAQLGEAGAPAKQPGAQLSEAGAPANKPGTQPGETLGRANGTGGRVNSAGSARAPGNAGATGGDKNAEAKSLFDKAHDA